MKRTVENPEGMEMVAKELFAIIRPQTDGATVIALSGDLGAGKTTFVQALARSLGIVERVVSPTFVIEKRYPLPTGQIFKTLVHIDAYRIDDVAELLPLRFFELLRDTSSLVVIEWPERIVSALPKNRQTVRFTFLSETVREVELL